MVDFSEDLKIVVREDRIAKGSRIRNAVPPPTKEEVHVRKTERGLLTNDKP